MHRNLDRRVETLVSLKEPLHVDIVNDLFEFAFDPGTAAWDLDSDGVWHRRMFDEHGEPLEDLQQRLINASHRGGAIV